MRQDLNQGVRRAPPSLLHSRQEQDRQGEVVGLVRSPCQRLDDLTSPRDRRIFDPDPVFEQGQTSERRHSQPVPVLRGFVPVPF